MKKINKCNFLVSIWLDGYDNQLAMDCAAEDFIKEQLNFTASQVKVRRSFRDELLQEILDFNNGVGKYNFSSLSDYDRNNAAFDAWSQIKSKIEKELS